MIRERQIFCHLHVIKEEEKYDYRQKSWKSHFFVLWWGKRGIQGKRKADRYVRRALSVTPKLNSVDGVTLYLGFHLIGMKIRIYGKSCFYCGIVILSVHGYLYFGTETLLFTDLAVTAKMLE